MGGGEGAGDEGRHSSGNYCNHNSRNYRHQFLTSAEPLGSDSRPLDPMIPEVAKAVMEADRKEDTPSGSGVESEREKGRKRGGEK